MQKLMPGTKGHLGRTGGALPGALGAEQAESTGQSELSRSGTEKTSRRQQRNVRTNGHKEEGNGKDEHHK